MTRTPPTDKHPPYPRLGELYRSLAGALDTKARDRDVDRLAREGEFDWSLLSPLRDKLITGPLNTKIDGDTAELVGQFIAHLHASYLRLVATVPLDGLNRTEALPILVEHYFGPHASGLLLGIKQTFGGPDLMDLLDPDKAPLAVVLDWLDEKGDHHLANTAFPQSTGGDRTDRELVARWASGKHLPDLQSIKRFAEALSKHGSAVEKELVPNLRRWLLVARALSWLEERSPVSFRAVMRRHLLLGLQDINIGRVLSLANIEGGERFSALKMPALMLYEDLKRTTPKTPGDQARIKDKLDVFRRLHEQHDRDGRTRFHVEWLLGRWHVLSGHYKPALSHYKEAAELADYRAGDQQKQIVEETLVLAAFVGGQKPLIKALKHRAIVFGLFSSPQGNDVIEEWEIDHLRQQFHQTFPHQGRFPEAWGAEESLEPLPFLLLDEEKFDQIEPDLRKPDRVRAVRFQDGQERHWPQLRLFASLGKSDAVRALLDHGASVDQLDKAGASALLCAIQHAEESGDRRALDLLLGQVHAKTTLDSATARKRLTPLICAVEYGEPDVVDRLLTMGATPDRRGQVDDVTPLYRCLGIQWEIRNPDRVLSRLRDSLVANPDHIQREVRRRHNVSTAGVFGDAPRRLQENPRHRAIFEKSVDVIVKQQLERHSEAKLLRIVQLLLEAGADPNAAHEYPTPGRTPLMLAAENDSVEAFDLMLQHGGDPGQRDAEDMNCNKIAIGFSSYRIADYLCNRGIQ